MSLKRALFSEPKVLITGVEGAGKTLFAVQQSDLLSKAESAPLYQVNIRGADPHHLPKLPFDLREMSDEVDPETGDQLPRWAAELEPGTVVIVDECHKVYPQRGPGRPPKDIEMLGEGRQKGIRFVYLSQSPESIDAFLRDRIHRHFHLERRGNMERATVFEFDHYVFRPRTAWQERKDAITHFWAYPKEYFGWYTSAKTHTFKRRIPLKIWAALAFIPLAGFIAWKVWTSVGGLASGITGTPAAAAAKPSPAATAAAASRERRELPTFEDPQEYARQFFPLQAHQPWSALAYQGRKVQAEPEIYCVASKAGIGGDDRWHAGGCTCLTEQGTSYPLEPHVCEHVARHGNYNPFREPAKALDRPSDRDARLAGPKPVEPRVAASGVAQQGAATDSAFGDLASYGDLGIP